MPLSANQFSKIYLWINIYFYQIQPLDLNIPYKEDELIALLRQKSLETFSGLYDKYAPALYTVVLQIVREEEIANTVLQKVFLDIFYNINNYDPVKEKLFTWMFKMARNAAIDLIKLKNSEPSLHQSAATTKLLHEAANLEMDNYGLKKVIKKLKEEHKVLVDLCYYKGFTHDEIALALNIPVETVQPKLRMALLELKTLLL